MADLEDVTLDGRPLQSLRVADLKAALEERGLSKSGHKNALIKRLKGALMLENLQKTSTPHVGLQPNSQIGEEMSQNSFIKQYLAKQQELLRHRLEREAREAYETNEQEGHTQVNNSTSCPPPTQEVTPAGQHKPPGPSDGEGFPGSVNAGQGNRNQEADVSSPPASGSMAMRAPASEQRSERGSASSEVAGDSDDDDSEEDGDDDEDWGNSAPRRSLREPARVPAARSGAAHHPQPQQQHIPSLLSPQLRQPTPPPSPPPELSFPLPDTPKQSPPSPPVAAARHSPSSSSSGSSSSDSRSSSPEPQRSGHAERKPGPLTLLARKMESEGAFSGGHWHGTDGEGGRQDSSSPMAFPGKGPPDGLGSTSILPGTHSAHIQIPVSIRKPTVAEERDRERVIEMERQKALELERQEKLRQLEQKRAAEEERERAIALEQERVERQQALEREEREKALQRELAQEKMRRETEEALAKEREEKERAMELERQKELERERVLEEERLQKERKEKEKREREEMERAMELERAKERERALEQERLERERALEAERREKERLERDKAAEQERLEKERIEREKALEKERLEKERIEREKALEKERLEKERIEREKALEKERLEKERIEREKALEKERLEKERIEREKALEKERLEKERIEIEKALEKERLEKERIEREKALEKERMEKERIQREKALEQERLEKERIEREKALEKKRLEKERIEREKALEMERLEKERLVREKALEQEKLEKQRIEREKAAELERIEREQALQQRIEREKALEQEKLELEKKEKERIEREQALEKQERQRREREENEQAERQTALERDKMQKERAEKERTDQIERKKALELEKVERTQAPEKEKALEQERLEKEKAKKMVDEQQKKALQHEKERGGNLSPPRSGSELGVTAQPAPNQKDFHPALAQTEAQPADSGSTPLSPQSSLKKFRFFRDSPGRPQSSSTSIVIKRPRTFSDTPQSRASPVTLPTSAGEQKSGGHLSSTDQEDTQIQSKQDVTAASVGSTGTGSDSLNANRTAVNLVPREEGSRVEKIESTLPKTGESVVGKDGRKESSIPEDKKGREAKKARRMSSSNDSSSSESGSSSSRSSGSSSSSEDKLISASRSRRGEKHERGSSRLPVEAAESQSEDSKESPKVSHSEKDLPVDRINTADGDVRTTNQATKATRTDANRKRKHSEVEEEKQQLRQEKEAAVADPEKYSESSEETPKALSARKISLSTSKPSPGSAEVEHETGAVAGRKRRWGSSTAVTAKKPSISITTESLKSLIPDIRPPVGQEAAVDLHPEEAALSGTEDEDRERSDQDLQIRRTVTQVVPVESQENGQKEAKILRREDFEEEDSQVEGESITAHEEQMDTSLPAAVETQSPTLASQDTETNTVTPSDTLIRRSISQQKTGVSITIDDPVRTARQPSPPRGEASSIVHIWNLVRPFTLGQLKELLSRTGTLVEEGFWIDKIKSHCYVTPHKPGGEDTGPAPGRGRTSGLPSLLPERDQWAEREREMERRERARAEREWDRDKVKEFGKAGEEREGGPRRSQSRERRRKERGKSKEKKIEKKAEDPPAKLLDDLFRKTKAVPCIYWLPLTEEQFLQREAARAERVKEREERRKEREKKRKEEEEEEEKKREEERKERTKAAGTSTGNRSEGEKDKGRDRERDRGRGRDRDRDRENDKRRDGYRRPGGSGAASSRRSRSRSEPRERRR
ncbi:hypothetical protein CRENBAI_017281 [Crenichthys baileyi]|uniref:SAP domain-containing protein n=1 Tax=Crenichthys baileyi TaxID=28760 RepID=A0AAV9R2X3_9TELE